MITRSLISIFSITFITLCTQSAFSETLSTQEADLITKEDIAATQVLAEVCPALIGNNPILKTKIDGLTQSSLKSLSKSMTLEQLQQDAEYKAAFKEAQTSAKEVDNDENKAVCNDILTLES